MPMDRRQLWQRHKHKLHFNSMELLEKLGKSLNPLAAAAAPPSSSADQPASKSWSKRMVKPRFSLHRYSSKQVGPVYGQYERNMGEKRVPAESYAKYRLDMRKFKL